MALALANPLTITAAGAAFSAASYFISRRAGRQLGRHVGQFANGVIQSTADGFYSSLSAPVRRGPLSDNDHHDGSYKRSNNESEKNDNGGNEDPGNNNSNESRNTMEGGASAPKSIQVVPFTDGPGESDPYNIQTSHSKYKPDFRGLQVKSIYLEKIAIGSSALKLANKGYFSATTAAATEDSLVVDLMYIDLNLLKDQVKIRSKSSTTPVPALYDTVTLNPYYMDNYMNEYKYVKIQKVFYKITLEHVGVGNTDASGPINIPHAFRVGFMIENNQDMYYATGGTRMRSIEGLLMQPNCGMIDGGNPIWAMRSDKVKDNNLLGMSNSISFSHEWDFSKVKPDVMETRNSGAWLDTAALGSANDVQRLRIFLIPVLPPILFNNNPTTGQDELAATKYSTIIPIKISVEANYTLDFRDLKYSTMVTDVNAWVPTTVTLGA